MILGVGRDRQALAQHILGALDVAALEIDLGVAAHVGPLLRRRQRHARAGEARALDHQSVIGPARILKSGSNARHAVDLLVGRVLADRRHRLHHQRHRADREQLVERALRRAPDRLGISDAARVERDERARQPRGHEPAQLGARLTRDRPAHDPDPVGRRLEQTRERYELRDALGAQRGPVRSLSRQREDRERPVGREDRFQLAAAFVAGPNRRQAGTHRDARREIVEIDREHRVVHRSREARRPQQGLDDSEGAEVLFNHWP